MKTETRFRKETQDRVRIGRARRYIRAHAAEGVSLAGIAGEAAASPYHFSRLFIALTGETVFGYVTRVRLQRAAALLVGDPRLPVTEAALAVGYQTPSAFNRVFRAAFGLSPSRFRTASPARRRHLLARLEDPRRRRAMKLDLSTTPEIRQRPDRPYLHVSRTGACAEEAPPAWEQLNRLLAHGELAGPETEYIGASLEIAGVSPEGEYRYDAGITSPTVTRAPAGLQLGRLAGGRYAVFRYRGSYRRIWEAVDQIFRGWVAQGGVTLRKAPLLEVYLNDPRVTPESDLLTDLCVPIA